MENIVSKKTTILNAAGEELVGVLDGSDSKELIILCHGLNSSKDRSFIINVASMLVEAGLTVFRFDFSGNGESQGQFQFGNYSKEVEDLHSVVLHWIRSGHSVKAIIGHSKGGSTVLLYASKYGDVHTIVNVSGRFDLKDGLEQILGEDFMEQIEKGFLDVKDQAGTVQYRVTKESLQERLNTDLKTAAASIPKDCRILTIHGSKDEIVAVENAFECNKVVRNHTLRIIDGADHMYSQHERDLANILVDFLKNDVESGTDHEVDNEAEMTCNL